MRIHFSRRHKVDASAKWHRICLLNRYFFWKFVGSMQLFAIELETLKKTCLSHRSGGMLNVFPETKNRFTITSRTHIPWKCFPFFSSCLPSYRNVLRGQSHSAIESGPFKTLLEVDRYTSIWRDRCGKMKTKMRTLKRRTNKKETHKCSHNSSAV